MVRHYYPSNKVFRRPRRPGSCGYEKADLAFLTTVVGGVMAVSKLMLLVQPTAFFETVGMGSIVAESETPLAKSLIVNLAVARLALGILGVASYFRGSETRARIGAAIAVVLVASIYADVAIPLEFELDKRGRATDVPVPLDLTSLKFLSKIFLVVPLVVALAAAVSVRCTGGTSRAV